MKKILFSISTLVLSFPLFAGEIERQGFLIGFNVGGGSFEDKNFLLNEDRVLGINYGFYIGGSLNQNLALMGIYDGTGGVLSIGGENVVVSAGVLAFGVQYALDNGFFVRGGPGMAATIAQVEIDNITYESDRFGFGAVINPGWEFYQNGRFAIDGNLKFVPHIYTKKNAYFGYTMGAGVGFSWY